MDTISPIALPAVDVNGHQPYEQLAGAVGEYNVMVMMHRELPALYEARALPSRKARKSAESLQMMVEACPANAQALRQISEELDGPWGDLAGGLADLFDRMGEELDFRFVHGSGELIRQLSELPAASDALISMAASMPAPPTS